MSRWSRVLAVTWRFVVPESISVQLERRTRKGGRGDGGDSEPGESL
jgi:hypothetical protein